MKFILLTTLFCLASSVEITGQGNLRAAADSADSYDSSVDVPAAVTARMRIAKKP
ncbi:hypothetical protein THAOC_17863, partial [Thalassiosira oceanica]